MNLFEFFARRRRRTRSRGQSLVEFALILPLLMVFLATILDLGRIYYANISLLNAAREGAFQASKTPDSYDDNQPCNTTTNLIVCRVQLESKGSMVEVDESDIDMSCSKSGCPLEANSTVTVHVRGEFQLITPILGFIFGGQTLGLDTAATQQIEYFPTGGVSTLPPTPVAAFTASDLDGEAPFAVSFDGTSSQGVPTDFLWDFGDGMFAAGDAQVTHVYTEPGDYTVTLRIINLAGDDTATMIIKITAPEATPTPTPEGTPTPDADAQPDARRRARSRRTSWAITRPQQRTSSQRPVGPTSSMPTSTPDTKNKIQAQTPDHTLCRMKSTTTVIAHYRPGV